MGAFEGQTNDDFGDDGDKDYGSGAVNDMSQSAAPNPAQAPVINGGLLDPRTFPQATQAASSGPSNSLAAKLAEAGLQVDTVVRHAANVMTGGVADKAEAAADTLFTAKPWDWYQKYKADLQAQMTRNTYDSTHRQVAGDVGDVLGIGLDALGAFKLGAGVSNALPIRAKGQLGEGLSLAKSALKGNWPKELQARKIMQNGKYTVVDHVTRDGTYVESKFGRSARLSKNQQYAQKQWGPGYRVDRWLPEHVGLLTAPLGAGLGLGTAFGQRRTNDQREVDQENSFLVR